jgi:hypothetical protein
MPAWNDYQTVVAAQVMARAATPVRGTLDLRSKYGAFIFIKIGRGGTTALTNGVDVLIRRVLNNGVAAVGGVHPIGIPLLSSTAAAASKTVGADAAAGATSLTVSPDATSLAAGDIICIQDSGGGVTRLEWARISKISGSVLTLDAPLQFAHTLAQADTVRNKSDVFEPIWVDGGSLYSVIFDYGDDAAGDSVTIQAMAQIWDS